MSTEPIYYTYLYLDPRKTGKFKYGKFSFDYEPFYVGYGKNKRYLSHLREAKDSNNIRYKHNKIRKIIKYGVDPIIIKFNEQLKINDAKEQEILLISSIGRYDIGTGPLTNLTNGGEGASGIIRSVEHTRKIVQKLKGQKRSKEFREQCRNRMNIFWASDRGKKIIENKLKGQIPPNKGKKTGPLSEDRKEKISQSVRNTLNKKKNLENPMIKFNCQLCNKEIEIRSKEKTKRFNKYGIDLCTGYNTCAHSYAKNQ